MKTLHKSAITVLAFAMLACASQSKSVSSAAEIEALQSLISEKSFEIIVNWARPLATGSLNRVANAGLIPVGSTANRIDITGNGSYLRILGDSVAADLPYIRERQMGGGAYNRDESGIKFEGIPQDFELVPNDKSQGYIVNFTISQSTETFQVSAKLFPNRSSTINVISSHRTAIGFDGRVSEYGKE